MTAEQERTWGMLSHALPLAATLVTGFGWLAALAIYMIHKDKSRFVAFHAFQAMLFQIALFVVMAVGVIAFITVIGIPVAFLIWIAAAIAGLIYPILAAIKANEGQVYALPIVGDVARRTTGV